MCCVATVCGQKRRDERNLSIGGRFSLIAPPSSPIPLSRHRRLRVEPSPEQRRSCGEYCFIWRYFGHHYCNV